MIKKIENKIILKTLKKIVEKQNRFTLFCSAEDQKAKNFGYSLSKNLSAFYHFFSFSYIAQITLAIYLRFVEYFGTIFGPLSFGQNNSK